MYLCEKCGKEVYEKYASGRFCSRSCACGYSSLTQSKDSRIITTSNLTHTWKGRKRSGNTDSELAVSKILDELNIRYEREKLVKGSEHNNLFKYYIMDFYLPDTNIDFEVNGSSHNTSYKINHDKVRTENLINAGYIVIILEVWDKFDYDNLKSEIINKLSPYYKLSEVRSD